MANIAQDLFPDERLVVQLVIFAVALVSANYFFVKPALRLHNERKRRTSGAIDAARSDDIRAETLETAYNKELKSRTDEAKNLRLSEVLAGQAEAEAILATAQEKAQQHVNQIHTMLSANIAEERAKIPSLVEGIVASIMSQMGVVKLFLFAAFLGATSFYSRTASAAEEAHAVDFYSGIFWPYFQFLCFLVAVVYFGRKPIHKILQDRRDTLRTKLSEAKEAVEMARRKTAEFEKKIASLQTEINELRAQYIQDGVRERTKIVTDAQHMAEQIVKDSERVARELVSKGKAELRRELLEIAVQKLEAQLTPERTTAMDKILKAEALGGIPSASQVH